MKSEQITSSQLQLCIIFISWLTKYLHIHSILRHLDLIDETRYNLIIPIAKVLGMKTDLKPGEPPYYKEDALSILCKAIYHSFKSARVAMIDHHNLIDVRLPLIASLDVYAKT